jgi:hypothetical protein
MNANEIETDFDIFKSKIKKNINSLFLEFYGFISKLRFKVQNYEQ